MAHYPNSLSTHPTQAFRAVLLVVVVLYLSYGVVPHVSAQGTPIDLGANTEYIGPHLWVILQRQADGETVPDFVVVEIGYRIDLEVDPPLEEFIHSVGGERVAEYTWRIPTKNALSVIQRPDLLHMAQLPEATEGEAEPYPTMDDTLNDIVAAYTGGVTEEDAVRYALFVRAGSVVLEMETPDAATVGSIRKWLTQRGVYVPPESDFEAFSDDFLSALVPVSRLTALAAAFSATYFSVSTHAGQGLPLDRAQWPAETLEFEKEVVAQFLPPQQGGATPAPTPTPTVVPPPPVAKYDSDGDGLIEIEFLEQLDAIRYDLDGDGIPEDATKGEYAAAYPVSGEEVVFNNCNGYELARPLDFDGDGVTTWQEFGNQRGDAPGPAPIPTAIPTPTPVPTATLPPTPTPAFAPTSTPALVEPTNTAAPPATVIPAQERIPAPESGGACSYPDEHITRVAAVISMFLLTAPLTVICGLKFGGRRWRIGD